MRPWIHIPLLILITSLALAAWVLVREVPVERQGTMPVLAAEMPSPFGSSGTTGPQGVLEGILMDAQGKPLALADLSTLQDGRTLWTHSDEQGRFLLQGLQDGPLDVSVSAEGYLPETLAVPGPRTKIQLSLKRRFTPPPTLTTVTSSTWRGRIRNPRDPADLANFEIWVNPTGPATEITSGIPRRTLTNEEGRFQIPGLIHSEYSIHLLPPDSRGGMGPDLLTPMGADWVILRHGSESITMELTSVGGALQGIVLAGPATKKEPVRAAIVMLTALTQGQGDGAVDKVLPAVLTDQNGAWSAKNLKPGPYRILVRGGSLTAETTVEVNAGQTLTVVFPD